VTQSIVVEPAQTQVQAPAETVAQPDLPAKYQGKSLEEVIEIARALESDRGRLANEVGGLRKLTDQVLGLAQNARFQPAPQQHEKPAPVTSEDLLSRPEETVTEIAKRVADERGSASETRLGNLEARLALDSFQRKYPDFEQTMGDPKFQQWVSESPYRQKIANAAAQKGDFDAADELFGLYAASNPAAEKPKQTDPLEAARQAGLARKGGSSAAGVAPSSANDGKKVYSRNELIDMRINKPEEFNSRYASEFLPAYKEGRVK
jgi:hypothetical protein